MVSFNQFKKPV